MEFRDIIGVATAIIVLAGITVAIKNGTDTANIIGKVGDSFSSVVRAATLQPGAGQNG